MLRRAIVLAFLVATARRAEWQTAPPAPLSGDWQLNLGRTHYGPGVDRRRREHMVCTAESAVVHCVIQGVRSDGRELTGRFTASLDGKPSPVTGIPDIDQVQLRRPSVTLVDATFFFHGEPAFGYRAFQSDDGRSLMIMSVDPITRAVATTVVVYDRR